MTKKVAIKCFCAQEAEMSSRPLISSKHERRNFSLIRRTSSLESWNQMSWAQGGQYEPNGRKILLLNVNKIFHEQDLNGVKKWNQVFWAQDTKISHKHDEHDH